MIFNVYLNRYNNYIPLILNYINFIDVNIKLQKHSHNQQYKYFKYIRCY